MRIMPRRYHPSLVLLHWAVALMSTAALYFGSVKLVPIPNDEPFKINGLRVHMIVGTLILVLVLIRLFVRKVTTHPLKATTGNAFLDRVGELSHGLLYASLIGQALLGLILAYQARLFDVVFAHRGAVPKDFWVYWPRSMHYALARLLMFLIVLHVCAALYHTFVLKDGFLRRMWFGARTPGSETL